VTPTLIGRVLLVLGVWAIFAATDDNYRTFDNLYAMLEGFALLGLVALGVGVTMIAGELDLSVASLAAVAGIIAIELTSLGLVPAVLLTTLAAVVFGAAQGFVIAKLRINSLVFTIGTLIALRGLAFVISDERAVLIDLDDLGMAQDVTRRLWIFSPFSLVTLSMLMVIGFLLALSRYGREIYAIGGARQEAVAAGVSRMRPLVVAFAVSAMCAGLAGSLASIKSGSAPPFAFEPILLSAVTAALVGGVSLYGGRGHVVGIVVGALALRFLISGFSSRGAPTYIESVATGALLLSVLLVEFLTEGPQMREWRRRRALSRDAVRRVAREAG
jgi:ribose/xylose/arabinose/galactoside ABC-type transport system permease subunit